MCDTIVLISGPALTTISFLLWTIVFGFLACALWSRKYERYLEVANWITSTLHAIVTTAVGILIVKNTRHDLIYAKCALTGTFPPDNFVLEDWSLTLYKRNHRSAAETFTFPHPEVFFLYCIRFPELHAFVLAGYFGHDSIVLFFLQWLKSSKDLRNVDKKVDNIVQQRRKSKAFCTYRLTLQKFLKSALAWHHILIFTVALPVILGIVILSHCLNLKICIFKCLKFHL